MLALDSALLLHEESLAQRCLEVIEQHAQHILSDPACTRLHQMSEDALCSILSSPRLELMYEVALFDVVLSWGRAKCADEAAGEAVVHACT